MLWYHYVSIHNIRNQISLTFWTLSIIHACVLFTCLYMKKKKIIFPLLLWYKLHFILFFFLYSIFFFFFLVEKQKKKIACEIAYFPFCDRWYRLITYLNDTMFFMWFYVLFSFKFWWIILFCVHLSSEQNINKKKTDPK